MIRTLLHVFPACRGFRDSLGESSDPEDGALKNLVSVIVFGDDSFAPWREGSLLLFVAFRLVRQVIFCSARTPATPAVSSVPSASRSEDVSFRKPVEQDFLGSYLRQKILGEFEQHEVDLRAFASIGAPTRDQRLLRRGKAGSILEKLQRGSGVATWKGEVRVGRASGVTRSTLTALLSTSACNPAMRELMPVEVWNIW